MDLSERGTNLQADLFPCRIPDQPRAIIGIEIQGDKRNKGNMLPPGRRNQARAPGSDAAY